METINHVEQHTGRQITPLRCELCLTASVFFTTQTVSSLQPPDRINYDLTEANKPPGEMCGLNPSVSLAGDVYNILTLRGLRRTQLREKSSGMDSAAAAAVAAAHGSWFNAEQRDQGQSHCADGVSLALQYKVAYKSVGAFRSYYYYYYDQGISLVVTFHLFRRLRWDSDRQERSISAE